MSLERLRDFFLAEFAHKPELLVYEIQKDIGAIFNKEVLKESGDYYGGGVVAKSGYI